jgi:hypothetical protein
MPRYRADIIGDDGRFRNCMYLEFAGDDDAIETLRRLAQRHYAIELWEGNRKVAAFKGE